MDDFETAYRAMASRDARFDGRFVVAVTSTGIYCRPSCPSRTPRRENTRFFRLPAAAVAAGFRACRRCRPDAQPSSPEWNARGDLVARALRLIAAGTVDRVGVTGLARRLAVSERHLHRQLVAEVGVGPQPLAISRRAQVARLLVESGGLSMAEVAFAAGYSSVRQFNDGVRAAFGCAPSDLRRAPAPGGQGGLFLRLSHRPPLPAGAVLDWLRTRALPGVESVEPDRYRRTLRLTHGFGVVAVELEESAATVRLSLADLRDVTAAVQKCREIFDLDADPAVIAETLDPDPELGPLVRKQPGLRVPGCADGFEFAARALAGRSAARLLVGNFGEQSGDPKITHVFPTPAAVAGADLAPLGVPRRAAATLRALATKVDAGELRLDRGADRTASVAKLSELPGMRPPMPLLIAMHALGDPDVFPLPDHELAARAGRWRPWRSYAAMYLAPARP